MTLKTEFVVIVLSKSQCPCTYCLVHHVRMLRYGRQIILKRFTLGIGVSVSWTFTAINCITMCRGVAVQQNSMRRTFSVRGVSRDTKHVLDRKLRFVLPGNVFIFFFFQTDIISLVLLYGTVQFRGLQPGWGEPRFTSPLCICVQTTRGSFRKNILPPARLYKRTRDQNSTSLTSKIFNEIITYYLVSKKKKKKQIVSYCRYLQHLLASNTSNKQNVLYLQETRKTRDTRRILLSRKSVHWALTAK